MHNCDEKPRKIRGFLVWAAADLLSLRVTLQPDLTRPRQRAMLAAARDRKPGRPKKATR